MLPKLFEGVINEGDEKLLKLILEKKIGGKWVCTNKSIYSGYDLYDFKIIQGRFELFDYLKLSSYLHTTKSNPQGMSILINEKTKEGILELLSEVG